MGERRRGPVAGALVMARRRTRQAWRMLRTRGPSQIQFWFIALLIGIAAGVAALGFRLGISALQTALYGTDDVMLATHAGQLPWYWVLVIPIGGGLVVGLLLHRFTPDGRVRAVADVIEGAALNNGRVEKRAGLASALASLITLSSGGSSGREGPVVHLAGVISSWVAGPDQCRWHHRARSARLRRGRGRVGELQRPHRGHHVRARGGAAPLSPCTPSRRLPSPRRGHGRQPAAIRRCDRVHAAGQGMLAFYVELPAFMILGLVSGLVAVAS
jgi:chloride channel protein, CIC family